MGEFGAEAGCDNVPDELLFMDNNELCRAGGVGFQAALRQLTEPWRFNALLTKDSEGSSLCPLMSSALVNFCEASQEIMVALVTSVDSDILYELLAAFYFTVLLLI